MAKAAFSWPGGRGVAFSLSFGDARASQADVTFLLLESYGVKGTFYANPGNVAARYVKAEQDREKGSDG